MLKPPGDTYWSRLRLLIRGLVFYNTVYWRKASDGLNPPKLTPQERRELAPSLNLDVVKPRARPRARIDESRQQHMREELARLWIKLPPEARTQVGAAGVAVRTPKAVAEGPLIAVSEPARRPIPLPVQAATRRRRRSRGAAKSRRGGLWARWFGKG